MNLVPTRPSDVSFSLGTLLVFPKDLLRWGRDYDSYLRPRVSEEVAPEEVTDLDAEDRPRPPAALARVRVSTGHQRPPSALPCRPVRPDRSPPVPSAQPRDLAPPVYGPSHTSSKAREDPPKGADPGLGVQGRVRTAGGEGRGGRRVPDCPCVSAHN